jgi:hypothetical protein
LSQRLLLLDNRRAARDTPRPLWCPAPRSLAGLLAFALSIRLCPLPAIREDPWMRLTAAGVLGEAGGRLDVGPLNDDDSVLA